MQWSLVFIQVSALQYSFSAFSAVYYCDMCSAFIAVYYCDMCIAFSAVYYCDLCSAFSAVYHCYLCSALSAVYYCDLCSAFSAVYYCDLCSSFSAVCTYDTFIYSFMISLTIAFILLAPQLKVWNNLSCSILIITSLEISISTSDSSFLDMFLDFAVSFFIFD